MGEVRVDFAEVMAHVRASIATIAPVDSPEALRALGVRVVARAPSRLTGPQHRRGRRRRRSASTRPCWPPARRRAVPPTSRGWRRRPADQRLGLGPDELPRAAAGARRRRRSAASSARRSPASASQVTLVESADRLLPARTRDAAGCVQAALRRRRGRRPHRGRRPPRSSARRAAHARLADGTTVVVDRVLVATGRAPAHRRPRPRPRPASRSTTGATCVVDARLRTTHPRIWAAGDLTGHPPFTHVAGVHGSLAASNAVLGLRRTVAPDLVPRVTYTQPEVAAFGVGPDEAEQESGSHRAPGRPRRGRPRGGRGPHRRVLRAGARPTRPGRRAPASSAPGPARAWPRRCSRRSTGAPARTVAGTMHAYPTWSDGVWKAAPRPGARRPRGPARTPSATRTRWRALRRRWVRRSRRAG